MNTNLYFIYKPTNKWVNCNEKSQWVLVDSFSEITYHEAIYEMINEVVDDIKCNFEDIDIIDKDGKNWIMNPEEASDVLNSINQEGFHYCFNNFSMWSHIKDEYFHKLRKDYIEITKDLTAYLHSKITP